MHPDTAVPAAFESHHRFLPWEFGEVIQRKAPYRRLPLAAERQPEFRGWEIRYPAVLQDEEVIVRNGVPDHLAEVRETRPDLRWQRLEIGPGQGRRCACLTGAGTCPKRRRERRRRDAGESLTPFHAGARTLNCAASRLGAPSGRGDWESRPLRGRCRSEDRRSLTRRTTPLAGKRVEPPPVPGGTDGGVSASEGCFAQKWTRTAKRMIRGDR